MFVHFQHKTKAADLFSDISEKQKNLTIIKTLGHFQTVTLGERNQLDLLRRMDTKFIFHETFLPEILGSLSKKYDALQVRNSCLQPYSTCYFDTPDFKLYHQHHNDQRDRYKLRVRSYLETGLNVLEVKQKNNHDRTLKSRLIDINLPLENTKEIRHFLNANFPLHNETLVPKLTNGFYRISLFSRTHRERLALDLGIHFMTPGSQFSLPGVVVAEVKQPHFSVCSDFIQIMRQMRCRPTRFSKYCVGLALIFPRLKRNAFKPLLLSLQNLILEGGSS